MTTVQPVQDSPPVAGGTAAPRVPVPVVTPARTQDDTPPVQFSPPHRALAGRLAEKESLFESARKTAQASRTARQQKFSLDQAKARLEQIKLYSPYPADESPRAALIRRLIRLQEPPGDPSTLNFGVTRLAPQADDQQVSQALGAVQQALAQLPDGSPEPVPAPEDPAHAVELSAGVGQSWPAGTGISQPQDVHYLRTL